MVSGISLILLFVLLSIIFRKMDIPGAIAGGFIAFSLFFGGGFSMLSVLIAFFVLGVGASHWKKEYKARQGLAQENEGIRSVNHALANGGIAAIYALVAGYTEMYAPLFLAMSAGCLAAATSDTLSSELGNVLGRQYINIVNFKKDQRGKDGVVSLEGSLAGIVGSMCVGAVYFTRFRQLQYALFVLIAGILGNLIDSILGATLQQQKIMNNDQVNFTSTLLAGLSVWGMYELWG